jgi:hypothetical protein
MPVEICTEIWHKNSYRSLENVAVTSVAEMEYFDVRSLILWLTWELRDVPISICLPFT